MIATQESVASTPPELQLPPNFESIEGLMDMPNERLKQGPLVNVIGLVKDYMPPIATKGSDFKCTLTIVDLSTEEQWGRGIKLMIFWPEEKMPRVSGPRDVVVLKNVKVQMWSGFITLLANVRTNIHMFPASKIPPWPTTKLSLITKTSTANKSPLSEAESAYAAWLFYHVDKSLCGELDEFKEKSTNAMKVKDKFSVLKDVKAGEFYDLLGEVIRLYEKDGKVTMYLSDYTAHPLFYNNVWGGSGDAEFSARDGDPWGYSKGKKKAATDWPGPYGKLSIQLTVYDAHARYIMEQVKNGDWLLLKNVQMKMGSMGGCLEGFLRGDRDTFEGYNERKVQVQIIRKAEDAERNDVRWKEGLRRKRDWWDRFKKQKQKYLDESAQPGEKRKLDDADSKSNSKKRRKEKRAAAEQKIITQEQKAQGKLDLNSNVKCNHQDKPPTPLTTILNSAPRILQQPIGLAYPLPFTNEKYRCNVRVIDYFPHKLEDFAVGRRTSEYEVLSDYSGGESTDNEEDMRLFRRGKGFGGEKTWEWRFALKVVDADKKSSQKLEKTEEFAWLVVDNPAAQMLLNMDAVNLRQDEETLGLLKEVLFKLWGDLEEQKSALQEVQSQQNRKTANALTTKSPASLNALHSRPGDDIPPDSSDEESENPPNRNHPSSKHNVSSTKEALKNHDLTIVAPKDDGEQVREKTVEGLKVTNKAFPCCIQQYGIRVPEGDKAKADAGEGMRWRRMFGLWGTVIS